MLNVLTGVALTLLVTSLVAVFATRSARRRGIEEGRRQAIEAYRREQDAAVYLLLSRLSNLISRPCEDAALPSRAESIVDLVRAYQNAVAGLIAPMAPQMGRLEQALTALNRSPRKPIATDEIREAFVALRTEWPVRKIEVELLLRSLLGQLTTIDHHPVADMPRGSREPMLGDVAGSAPTTSDASTLHARTRHGPHSPAPAAPTQSSHPVAEKEAALDVCPLAPRSPLDNSQRRPEPRA